MRKTIKSLTTKSLTSNSLAISSLIIGLALSVGATSAMAIGGLLDKTSQPAKETLSNATESVKKSVSKSLPTGDVLTAKNPVAGRYIVALKRGNSAASLKSTLEKIHGGNIDVLYSGVFNGFAAEMTGLQAATMAADPRVRYVEQDGLVKLVSAQSNATWGLDRIDQRDLPLDRQFAYANDGKGVHTYIVDTGVRGSHAEFKGRMGDGYNVAAASPFFDQFLGDISGGLLGGGNKGDENDTNDCNGHGTHVAGTVAGTDYGVAKQAVIHPIRVLSCEGSGTTSGVIKGVEWITKNHKKPAVANMSLGGGASTALDEAVANSIKADITYVVAAGNENTDACAGSPSRVPAAITVASSAKNDKRSDFSNKGRCVDIFAPGSDITSAWHQHDRETKTISGTSMAAPHVAGAVALLLEQDADAKPADITQKILANATNGKISDLGGSPNKLLFVPVAAKKPTPSKPAPNEPEPSEPEPKQPEPSPQPEPAPKEPDTEQPKEQPDEQQPPEENKPLEPAPSEPEDKPADKPQDQPVKEEPSKEEPSKEEPSKEEPAKPAPGEGNADAPQAPEEPQQNNAIGSFAIQCQLLSCTLLGYSADGSQPQWQTGEGNTARTGNKVQYQYGKAGDYTLRFNQQSLAVEVGDYESTPCSGCDVWQGSVSSEKNWDSGMANIKTSGVRDFYAWVETPDERYLQARLQRKTGSGWETVARSWGNSEKQAIMADDMPAGEYRWIVTTDSRNNRFKLWSANSSD